MSLILSGTDGVSDIDGSAATPAIRGTDANTGIFFPAADTIAFAEGGAEIARFDSSGNLGIGTASPGTTPAGQLVVAGANVAFATNDNANVVVRSTDAAATNKGGMLGFAGASDSGNLTFATIKGAKEGVDSGYLAFATRSAAAYATERMRIDSSGNVGIGTSSPRTSKLDVMSATGTQNTSGDGSGLVNITGPNGPNGSQPIFVIATNDALAANIGPAITFQARYLTSSTAAATLGYIQCIKENATSNNLQGALTFVPRNSAGNFVEAMRIDSSGNVIVGGTSTSSDESTYQGGGVFVSRRASSAGTTHANFLNGGSTVGSITSNTTATFYNTTSDYRLKNTIAPMTGALDKVALLKPCTYKWNVDGSDGQGFIAHELQEVIAGCVTGEKDAVETYTDEDGNEATRPVHQGIDTSFLVATLTAAIQELKALTDTQASTITALTARIEALETQSADNPPQGETP